MDKNPFALESVGDGGVLPPDPYPIRLALEYIKKMKWADVHWYNTNLKLGLNIKQPLSNVRYDISRLARNSTELRRRIIYG